MKQCTKCKEVKSFSEFYHATAFKDGYFSQCKNCQHSYQRKTYQGKDPAVQKAAHLRRTFNLTRDEYDAMLQSQNGVCAACGNPETKIDHRTGTVKELAVDHDHATGRMRALLCNACNVA